MKLKELKEYRNIHAGRDIFVFGSGPSLYNFCEHPSIKNSDFFAKQITIAVNETINRIKNPSYFFTSDGACVYCSFWNDINKANYPIICSSQGCIDHFVKYGNIDENRELCSYQKNYELVMNKDAEALIFGITSPHCAVHFAHILGAKRIIVIGCDCGPVGGYLYYWDYPGEIKFTIPAHTAFNRLNSHNRKKAGWLDESFNYWKRIKAYNPSINIEVWGGRLESIFPKYRE